MSIFSYCDRLGWRLH